jgi:hypothetical protein
MKESESESESESGVLCTDSTALIITFSLLSDSPSYSKLQIFLDL